MASRREVLDYLLDQLSAVEGVTFRPMMGEYLLYCRGRLFGGIYDDRLLVKPVPSAVRSVRTPVYETPYEGAREMLLVENVDDRAYLRDLVESMYGELPERKKRKAGNGNGIH